MHTTNRKETICNDYILYDSNQATLWKKQNYGIKGQWFPRLEGKGQDEQQDHRGFGEGI